MADYNISLGVDVDVSSIQGQIKKAKISPIKVNIDVETSKTDIQNIKRQLSGMNFSNSSIRKITKDLDNMNLSVSKVTTNLKKNGNIEISVKGIDKLKRNISLVKEYTKNGDLLNGKSISQSFKTEIDEVNEAFNSLKQKQKEISSLEFKLAGLDSGKNASEIKQLTAQIRILKKEYDKLYSGYGDKLSSSQSAELIKGFQDAANKLKQLKLQTADEIKFKINTGDFNKDVSNIEEKAKKLGNVSKELKNNITQLKSNKTRMNTALEKGDIDAAIKAYERYLALLKTVNNQLGISSGGQKSIDADFKKLQQLASQIDSINKKLVGLKVDPQANDPLISELTRQLKEAEAAYNSLRSKLQGKLTSGQLEQLAASANAAENEIKELEAKIASLKAEEAAGIKLDIKSGTLKGQIDAINQKFKQLGIANQQVTNDITRLQSLLGNMDASDDVETVIADYQTFLQLLEIVGNKVDDLQRQQVEDNRPEMLSAKKEAAFQRLNSLFEEGSRAAEVFGARAAELRRELDSVGNIQGISLVNEKIKNLGIEIKNSHIQTKTIGTRLKEQFAKYGNYLSVASVIMYAGQAIRSAFEQVKLIDSAMTELKKVTNETDESYNQFLKNAASKSKELGTTIDGLISSTADFARLGYSFEESQGLAEVANVYAVVGDEIEGVEDATQSLVSTLAAFKSEMGSLDESEFAMSIVDKMNEVSNNFAISSGGIGEALQRSASSMAAANNSLDETIALITAANTVVQNPEKVGNAFKTMSMRIRGAKTELEEAGESTDGMAESTASLREEMLALSGVDIMLNDNTFKSTYQIMDELSKKWESLSDIAQATITELVAGKHQGNVMSSLMSNFDIARDALNTSLNSSGSAMAEHAKWSESLEARLNKLKSAWQSLSQTFMKSDFLKGLIDIATAFINILDKIIDKTGIVKPLLIGLAGKNIFGKISNTSKTIQLVGGLRSIGDVVNILINSFSTLKTAVGAFYTALSSGATNAAAFKTGIASFISGNWITLAIAAIGIAVTLFDKYTESAKELADRVEEVTSKYKEQHAELSKLKGDYDTSNEESMISRYGELSKGVNELGENLSLTADEYAEYKSIVEQLVSTNPELIAGYNSQGDAILENAGDVDTLAESYRNLIKAQNEEILTGKDEEGKRKDTFSNAKDILRDFGNDVRGTSAYYQTDGQSDYNRPIKIDNYNTGYLDTLQELMELSGDELSKAIAKLTVNERNQIANLLESSGIARDEIFKDVLGDGIWNQEITTDYIERALTKHVVESKAALDQASQDLNSYAEDLGTVTSAYFDQAFLGGDESHGIGDYSAFSERMQSIIGQTVSNLDADFYADILNLDTPEAQWQALTERYNAILDAFKGFNDTQAAKFEAAFDLRTQFNGGEISYGEYVQNIREAASLVDGLEVHDEVKNQLKLSLNTEQVEEDYNALRKRLETGGLASGAEEFLSKLTASEYAVAIDLIVNGGLDLTKFNIDSLRTYIAEKADVQDALNFNASIAVDTASLETLNTALSESASAIGLTSESIAALESKYKKLDGYDPSTLFEATANGVKVNREELARLEKQHNNLTKTKVQEHLNTLVEAYNDNVEAIDKCSNASERARLIAENETYKTRIEELAQYQSQLEGVTGAYQRWIDAQNTSEDYEGYEAVAKGWETVKDELSRGFLGNASKEYIDLLSGKDLRGADIDAYAAAWEKLDDKVTSTGYSVKDFFTLDDEGNVTATGIHRFFESVKEEFEGVYDEQKKTFDFSKENLQIIQEKYGIGIEAIGLLLEGASAAGYNIDWGGLLDGIDLATSNFETLLEYAESAQKAFNDLEIEGVSDVNFNFKTTTIEDATSELEKAQSIYNELINSDGNVNLDAPGAEQMKVMLSTLLVQKQQLEDSSIAINVDTSGLDESQQHIANAINAVKEFREKYKNLEIAVSTGEGIEEAKAALGTTLGEMQKLGDDGIDIAAKLILGEDANGAALKGKVDEALALVGENSNIPVGFKLDETELGNLNSQLLTNFTAEAVVSWTNNSSEVEEYSGVQKEGKGTIKWNNDDSLVVEFQNTNHDAFGTVYWDDNTVNLQTTYTGNGIIYWNSEATGTANAIGSTSGRAFARGNWGIKGSGTALGGELGQELVVRDGKFFTIGDNGAEFFNYKPNDIIFNAAQTESLFKYGGIKGAKPRGKMLATGTAFADGSHPSSGKAFWKASASQSIFASVGGRKEEKEKPSLNNTKKQQEKPAYSAKATETDFSKNNQPASSSDSAGGGGSGNSEFEETFDWIVTAIDRIEREIESLDKTANNVYKSWTERNSSLTSEIEKVGDEIDLQQQAYDRYMQEAESIGLDPELAKKIRDGEIDIETITDEDLAKKAREYETLYNNALNCQKAVEELTITESQLVAQQFENIETRYDGILQSFEHTESMINEYISQAEAQGHLISKDYYQSLIDNETARIDELYKERDELTAARDQAVADGTIEMYSEEWYNMSAGIDRVTQSIEQAETAMLEYDKAMREIDWEAFDLGQQMISDVIDESNFLIELMSDEKLHDENGKLTEHGMATMGLRAQNYNTYMHQADDYAAEIAKIDEDLAKDPNNQELINRRRELANSQRECILAAEEEKQAMIDLVKDGIELELDALQERIDKYNEAIDAAKDLYEYQKRVKEQTKEIANLEKQIAAYSGDDSEESKAIVQSLRVSLEEAQENLKDTEYDKYISDQKALLDSLYLEYETILNARLDNVDALLTGITTSVNESSTTIKTTLETEAGKVGTTISNAMNSIWSTGDGNAKSVLTMYGDNFKNNQTTINTTLNGIKASVDKMVEDSNKEAQEKTGSSGTQSSSQTNSSSSNKTNSSKSNKSSSGGDGVAKIGDKVKFVSGQYYYDSQGTRPLGSQERGGYVYITNINKKSWATHPYHVARDKNGKHPLGWLKLSQLSGYATGKKNSQDNEVAWTQENGEEFIVRPSDGAILTPIARGDSVLTADASNNIWNMANSPTEFVRESLNLGSANAPNNSTVNGSYTQNFENIVFSMPNVQNYDEFISTMQKDKNFERLILSMTIDRIAGKSSLAKGKAVR